MLYRPPLLPQTLNSRLRCQLSARDRSAVAAFLHPRDFSMRAITISSWGAEPTFAAAHPEPPTPATDSNLVRIKVLAAGLHQLVRAQATGTHYSTKTSTMPYIPGADGVGTTPDGQTVYFNSIATGGAFADTVVVPKAATTPIPAGADPVQIAGLLNPGMSSWMALATRVESLPRDFTVAIVGVTSISGKIAVQFARAAGAKKVIGIARNAKEMATLALDQAVVLADNPADTDFSGLGDVHVILDYVYGAAVAALFAQLHSSVPTQFVQIGNLGGGDLPLAAALLRSNNLTLRGSGPGAWSLAQFAQQLPALLDAVNKLPPQDLKVRRLEDVADGWAQKKERTVFVP